MKFLRKLKCWWFGHDTESQATGYDGYSFFWHCLRCNDELHYDSFCHATPYERATQFLRYWLFRKWFPVKCNDCGHRYKCDEAKDHIPF